MNERALILTGHSLPPFPFLPSVLEASHGSSKLQLRPLVQEEGGVFPREPSTLI